MFFGKSKKNTRMLLREEKQSARARQTRRRKRESFRGKEWWGVKTWEKRLGLSSKHKSKKKGGLGETLLWGRFTARAEVNLS